MSGGKFDRPSPPKFASARASLRETGERMETLLRKPMTSSHPPAPPVGKVVDDTLILSSEEEMIQAILAVRAKPEPAKVQELLSHIEHLLREGEIRFTNSVTRATKVPR